MALKRQLSVLGIILVLVSPGWAQGDEVSQIEAQIKAAKDKSDWAGVVQAATAALPVLAKALTAPKPETSTDDFWKNVQDRLKAEKVQVEYAAFEATTKETDPAKRIKVIELFLAGFEGSAYGKGMRATLAGLYQQSGDTGKALAAAQKSLETEPDNEGLHLMLADNDLSKKQLASAIEHARAALKILETKKKPEGYTDEAWAKTAKIIGGSAHSIAGQGLLLQEKYEASVPELKSASTMLADNQGALGQILYNLGFAYAKLRRPADAREVLARAAGIPGPYQKLSKDLLVAQTPKPGAK